MNVKKTVFVIGMIVILLILLAVRFGWMGKGKILSRKEKSSGTATVKAERKAVVKSVPEASRKKTPVPPEKKISPPAQKIVPIPAKTDLGAGDPFSYAGSSAEGYSPFAGNKHMGVIAVKGIIRIENEEPKAMLHLKDSDRVHYVRKNSVIRVNTKNKKGTTPAEVYIVVKDIRNDEVELIQLERPDKVIIIR